MVIQMKKRQYAALASSAYLILCIASFAYHFARTDHDKFSAIFIAGLTLPWSLGAALFKDLIIAGIFHYEIGFFGNNVILAVCALINTFFIYFLISRTKR